MHIEYTPEEVRTLIEEHEALDFTTATADDVAEATDVLEGVEELIGKLNPALRYETVRPLGIPVENPGGDHAWIPVANNCTRSAGVDVHPDGTLGFSVRAQYGTAANHSYYFAARQAIVHALANASASAQPKSDCSTVEQSPRVESAEEDQLATLLKENGWAVAAGRTLADVGDEVLARAYRLSEEGIAHLFSEGEGIVLAMAGSTAGDRRRAVQKLSVLPQRRYSSRTFSVTFDCGKTGDHYSEQDGFGHTIKEAPKPKAHLLEAAAERFRTARFIRPSADKPLDTGAIRSRVRRIALVQAAVRYALAVDPTDVAELVRRVTTALLIARYFSRKMVGRALDAERPWDSKAERNRMVQSGRRIRQQMLKDRREHYRELTDVPMQWTFRSARAIDDQRNELLAPLPQEEKLRVAIEGRRKSGRASYDTARAVYLQRCPDLEHKLLHLLRRDGVKAEAGFLSSHSNLAPEATNPEGALRPALRTLAEAGKVRRVCSHKTGEVFLTATEPLDETGYRRSLNGLIRDERFGIVNPWSEASPVEAEGEAGEWEKGLENLDYHEEAPLAPRRFRNTEAPEQQLMAAEEVAEYSAFEEVEAVAEGFTEDIA